MKYNYKVSWPSFRRSFKNRSKEYFLENSLHGVPYIVDVTRPKWERITWFILTMASVGATIGVIITIWDKFATEPTLTGLDTTTQHIHVHFPQVFLCYDWPHLNLSHIDESDEEILSKVYGWKWHTNISVSSPKENYETKKDFRNMFEKLMPDCSVINQNCTFSGNDISCNRNLTKMLTPVGACCKFNSSRPLYWVDQPWKFSFVPTAYPLRLYLLQKYQTVPLPVDKPFFTFLGPMTVQIEPHMTYTTSDLRYLTYHQRGCQYFNEDPIASNCKLACLSKKILKQCNCLPWFLSSTTEEECVLSKYSCIQEYSLSDCGCIPFCDYTDYAFSKIGINSKEVENVIKFVEWPKARHKREIRFGFLDLVVSFGGIASLFLGYSLLTSMEFAYYFTLHSYCGAVLSVSQKKEKKRNNVSIHVIKPKPKIHKIDVHPIYFDYVE